MDVHALKGSQNGFDNSGRSNRLSWTDENNFVHWPYNAGEWMGPYNFSSSSYDYIYTDADKGVNWGLDNVQKLMDRYGKH